MGMALWTMTGMVFVGIFVKPDCMKELEFILTFQHQIIFSSCCQG